MAKIVPYGDLNAHGSLGNSLSFRRRFNYVVLEKKPFPKQPNSAGQIAQRTAFKTALNEWYFLNSITKLFYNTRGPQLGMTGQNLYIKQKLLNNLPSTTFLYSKTISTAVLNNILGLTLQGIRFEWADSPKTAQTGRIYDFENIFQTGNTHDPARPTELKVDKIAGLDVDYPFRSSIAITYIDSAGATQSLLLRFPQFTAKTFPTVFYIASDGSLYWDNSFTQLACTPIF